MSSVIIGLLESSKKNDKITSILLYRPEIKNNDTTSNQSTLDHLMKYSLDFLVSGLKIHKTPRQSLTNMILLGAEIINGYNQKWHRVFVDTFKNHFNSNHLNLFFKLSEPEFTDNILEIFANMTDEAKVSEYNKQSRDEVQKGLHVQSLGPPLVGQKHLTGALSLEYDVYILMLLKCLRYVIFPQTSFKDYEQSLKIRIENYYKQQISTFWNVGSLQKINEDHYDFHRCVVKLIGKKNLDAIIVEDIQNFLLVELVNPKTKVYKVLMNEKVSSIAFDIDGCNVTCRKSTKKDGLKVKFLKKVQAEMMVTRIYLLIAQAKKKEMEFLRNCFESFESDLKPITSHKVKK